MTKTTIFEISSRSNHEDRIPNQNFLCHTHNVLATPLLFSLSIVLPWSWISPCASSSSSSFALDSIGDSTEDNPRKLIFYLYRHLFSVVHSTNSIHSFFLYIFNTGRRLFASSSSQSHLILGKQNSPLIHLILCLGALTNSLDIILQQLFSDIISFNSRII